MRAIDLSLATRISDEASLEVLHVAEFYDRALCSALANPAICTIYHGEDASRHAEILARTTTERRFGVRLILPGDKEDS